MLRGTWRTLKLIDGWILLSMIKVAFSGRLGLSFVGPAGMNSFAARLKVSVYLRFTSLCRNSLLTMSRFFGISVLRSCSGILGRTSSIFVSDFSEMSCEEESGFSKDGMWWCATFKGEKDGDLSKRLFLLDRTSSGGDPRSAMEDAG